MLAGNILDKKKVMLSMDKENISLKEMGPIIKVNGETIKLKEKGSLISDMDKCSILENGKLTSIMVGVYYTLILKEPLNGKNTKDNSKME